MTTYDKLFVALADPTRREIFERLRNGPLSVGELAADLPVTQPAVSQHLRVLREAKLVEARAMGTRRVYRLNRARLDLLRIYAESFRGEAPSTVES